MTEPVTVLSERDGRDAASTLHVQVRARWHSAEGPQCRMVDTIHMTNIDQENECQMANLGG